VLGSPRFCACLSECLMRGAEVNPVAKPTGLDGRGRDSTQDCGGGRDGKTDDKGLSDIAGTEGTESPISSRDNSSERQGGQLGPPACLWSSWESCCANTVGMTTQMLGA
jgi:hypothetical protein